MCTLGGVFKSQAIGRGENVQGLDYTLSAKSHRVATNKELIYIYIYIFFVGKSTLLDVLAGRKTTGEIGGDILFNGKHLATQCSSAYVMQVGGIASSRYIS